MNNRQNTNNLVGVVGLGLMGSSIIVALLATGNNVIAIAPVEGEKEKAKIHIRELLEHADDSGLLRKSIDKYWDVLLLTEDYSLLQGCSVVLECVIEDKVIKEKVYKDIAAVVTTDTIIASNTSAIPISELQEMVPEPQRFMGIHWAEPAYMTRFLEVTCGQKTDITLAEQIMELALSWDKEPTLLKKDIRGFITNRLMYAVYREALTLVEKGHISMGDADKAFRYDAGAWITFMGVFRRMDFMGANDYCTVFQKLFKELSTRIDVPLMMKQAAERGARGVHNLDGLYPYSPEQAKIWQASFADFNRAIYHLTSRYNEQDIINMNETYLV